MYRHSVHPEVFVISSQIEINLEFFVSSDKSLKDRAINFWKGYKVDRKKTKVLSCSSQNKLSVILFFFFSSGRKTKFLLLWGQVFSIVEYNNITFIKNAFCFRHVSWLKSEWVCKYFSPTYKSTETPLKSFAWHRHNLNSHRISTEENAWSVHFCFLHKCI